MNLKDGFCDIEAGRRDCLHDELLRILVTSSATDSKALARPGGGAVHSISSGRRRLAMAVRSRIIRRQRLEHCDVPGCTP